MPFALREAQCGDLPAGRTVVHRTDNAVKGTHCRESGTWSQVQYEFLKGAMHTSRADGEAGGGSAAEGLSDEMQELYIRLLCRYDGDKVYEFLQEHAGTFSSYTD